MNDYMSQVVDILYKLKEEGFEKNSINGETRIIDDVGVDSLEMINLFLSIEDTFDLEIEFETVELSVLETVNSLTNFVMDQCPSRGPGATN